MGTRAAFWMGNPQDLANRKWLGCVAFDGYPDGFEGELEKVKDEKSFCAFVKKQSKRNDFASPSGGWPYPWDGDIFLTDYTYAFFNGKLRVTCFHAGFQTLKGYLRKPKEDSDALPSDVPAPSKYSRSQPDSIIVIHAA